MSESQALFETLSPLQQHLREAQIAKAKVTLTDRRGLAMVQLFAKNGKSAALAKKLKIGDTPGKASVTKTFTALPLSPGQWMLVASSGADGTFAQSITKAIGALGYVSEQSDSRVCLSVSGEKARQVMAKGCRLDLHPSVVDTGFCAQTQMAQVGVLIHQSDDQPTYDLFVYSGFAASFWDWLEEASAEFHPNVKIEAN